jgi:serine/threonine protein kinase
MGQRNYTAAVDIWSLGCIYAEMLQGKPLFTGLCEIDQLFQIFYKMGTPTAAQWAEFSMLPNYQPTLFPDWTCVSHLSACILYIIMITCHIAVCVYNIFTLLFVSVSIVWNSKSCR